MAEQNEESRGSGLAVSPRAAVPDDIRLTNLDQFIEALEVIAQARLVDRRACARRTVEALYRLALMLRAHDALGPVGDLRDAFADLERGRRPELFEPQKKGGRRTSVREHRMKAWAVAAAEELEARGLDPRQANRVVAKVVEVYGMAIGRQDTRSSGSVIAGWRRNLGRARRTPEGVLSFLPGIRRVLHGCEDRQEVLSLLAHVGFEDVQFAPILGKPAAKLALRNTIEG